MMDNSMLQKYNLNIDSDSDDDSDDVDDSVKIVPKAAVIHVADLAQVIQLRIYLFISLYTYLLID